VLTPKDIHDVSSTKPPIGQRGYDEGEVDAFLELCEAEVAHCHAEIERLSLPVTQPQAAVANGFAGGGDFPERPTPQPVREAEQPTTAARILELAQETADKYVAEVKAKADAEAKAIVEQAKDRADSNYNEALAQHHRLALAKIEGRQK
jgi:DivIVA domain-containing protein